MLLVVLLHMVAVMGVGADFSSTDIVTATVEEALSVSQDVAELCIISPEVSKICTAAVVVTAAYFIVDFAADAYLHHVRTTETNTACGVFKTDFDEMKKQLDFILESVQRWRPMLDRRRFHDLSAETVNVLGLGNRFLEDARIALTDGDKLTSAAFSVSPRLTQTALVASCVALGLQPRFGHFGEAFLIVSVGAVTMTLQGCDDEPICNPDGPQLHGHLLKIGDDMSNALTYVGNLKNCVPDGKPVCSLEEMTFQKTHIQTWLRAVKTEMNEVENMPGMRPLLLASASSPALHDDSKTGSLVVNDTQTKHLTTMLNEFETLANIARAKGDQTLQAGGLQSFCPWTGLQPRLAMILLIAFTIMAVVLTHWRKIITYVCPQAPQSEDYQPMPVEEASWTWTYFGLFLAMACLLTVLVYAGSIKCQASMLRLHEMQMWTSHAEDIVANIRAQLACARVTCSHQEEEHLRMQFASLVQFTFSAFIRSNLE